MATGDIELELCEACDEEKEEAAGEWVVVDRTYVDHMQVAEERAFICGDCRAEADDMAVERHLEARWWDGYHTFKEQWG